MFMPTPGTAGLSDVVARYETYGPLLAAFLANLLATFGDKGQLVVITLASRYDARQVVAGAMGAFGLWSALEVLFGAWITRVVPADVMTALTGGLFVAFGLWTLRSGVLRLRVTDVPWPLGRRARADGAAAPAGVLPATARRFVSGSGGAVTSFVFILFAEFGDKTQLLTINLAATFPNAPLAVFIGVVAALGLRTGVDAVIGDRIERFLPTAHVEVGAAVVFVAFGLAVFGVVSGATLLGVIAVTLLALVVSIAARR